MNRVVPVLLVRDRGLVKTQRFKNPRYLGDPLNAVRIFNEKFVDELVVLDIARREDGPDFAFVETLASECFIPLAYGGSVRDANDARRLYSLGVEKVVVRTAAAASLDAVRAMAAVAGSQSVVLCIDIQTHRLRGESLHAPGTTRHGQRDWMGFARAGIAAGAGELMMTSIAHEGQMAGLNLDLIRRASSLGVPVVAHGGVGSFEHIREGFEAGGSAVAVGSFVVYHGRRRAVLISYPSLADVERIQSSTKVEGP